MAEILTGTDTLRIDWHCTGAQRVCVTFNKRGYCDLSGPGFATDGRLRRALPFPTMLRWIVWPHESASETALGSKYSSPRRHRQWARTQGGVQFRRYNWIRRRIRVRLRLPRMRSKRT